MNLDRNFSLRLDARTRAMLQEVSAKTGLSTARLVRQAVVESIQQWKTHGFTLRLEDGPAPTEPPPAKPGPIRYPAPRRRKK